MNGMRKETDIEQVHWWHYVGIVLLSLATLLLELALTRVLSVALWYHFGFLVISTALLGFGTSGIVLALWRRVREHASLDPTLALLALLFGVLTILCFWLMQHYDAQVAFSPGFRWGITILPGQEITLEDVYNHTSLTYPHTWVREMTGQE